MSSPNSDEDEATSVPWRDYEQVARYVLGELRAHLGLSEVSGYEDLPGKSGTSWRVEGKAYVGPNGNFLIMECRRHTTKGVTQEEVGGLAFRIQDTGASGAILVTPLPLQKGAALVAQSANVEHVELAAWSTPDNYFATILDRAFHGVTLSEGVTATDEICAVVIRDGKAVP